MNKILLIDDDPDFIKVLGARLTKKGFDLISAASAKEGMQKIESDYPDVVLLDVKLPDKSGVDMVSDIKKFNENISVIMVSGYGDVKFVVSAIKAGASDYIQKPVNSDDLCEKLSFLLEIKNEKMKENDLRGFGLIIGQSQPIKHMIKEIVKVASSDAPILLRGESGTGKTILAKIIHDHSKRYDKPFVIINCPTIPENLLESELFGHEKGAFTGASSEKIGKFELAQNGTLFLDEIGDLSEDLQAKLLRVLQNHEFERVGGLNTIKINARIIAATNRNLEDSMERRLFREDLFYRLNVLPIFIPSLRERRDDIPLLAKHFLQYFSKREKKNFEPLSEKIFEKLKSYDWPGNVRELENAVERAVVLSKSSKLSQIDFVLGKAKPEILLKTDEEKKMSIGTVQHDAIIKALKSSQGNISKAAKILGIGRDTFYRWMKRHGIDISRKK